MRPLYSSYKWNKYFMCLQDKLYNPNLLAILEMNKNINNCIVILHIDEYKICSIYLKTYVSQGVKI